MTSNTRMINEQMENEKDVPDLSMPMSPIQREGEILTKFYGEQGFYDLFFDALGKKDEEMLPVPLFDEESSKINDYEKSIAGTYLNPAPGRCEYVPDENMVFFEHVEKHMERAGK